MDEMTDVSDIAAAALKADGVGPCNCKKHTKDAAPSIRCAKCKGTGKITACLDCGGSGWNPKKNKTCPVCMGLGHL